MNSVCARTLGLRPYEQTWQAMKAFTRRRTQDTPDEIWLVQHPPVFTLGLKGKPEHLLDPGTIPVIRTDRGGQVTYHGPGQWILYPLIDLRRARLNARHFVHSLEQGLIAWLDTLNICAHARKDAPGVYVDGAKLASLGLKITRLGSYHGIALNVDMDLSPFSRINPCGLEHQPMTQLKSLVPAVPRTERLLQAWVAHTLTAMGLEDRTVEWCNDPESKTPANDAGV